MSSAVYQPPSAAGRLAVIRFEEAYSARRPWSRCVVERMTARVETARSEPARRCRSRRREDQGALEAWVVLTREWGSRRCWSSKSSRDRPRAQVWGSAIGVRSPARGRWPRTTRAPAPRHQPRRQRARSAGAATSITSVLSSARPPAAPWSARRRGCSSSRSCPRGTRTRRPSRPDG